MKTKEIGADLLGKHMHALRSIFYHTAELYNLLAWDFIDQPTKTFREGLAARLWEQGWLAECRAGRAATDLPASLDFYLSGPGPSLL